MSAVEAEGAGLARAGHSLRHGWEQPQPTGGGPATAGGSTSCGGQSLRASPPPSMVPEQEAADGSTPLSSNSRQVPRMEEKQPQAPANAVGEQSLNEAMQGLKLGDEGQTKQSSSPAALDQPQAVETQTTSSQHSSPPPQQQQQQQQEQYSNQLPQRSPQQAVVEYKSAMKMLIPSNIAGCLIGKGGCIISQMQALTGSKIKLSQNHEFFPGTTDRVCLITAPSDEGVLNAIMEMLRRLAEFHRHPGSRAPSQQPGRSPASTPMQRDGTESPQWPKGSAGQPQQQQDGQPLSKQQPSPWGGARDVRPPPNVVTKLLVPLPAVRLIIGQGGENIRAMGAKTGARVQLAGKGDNMVPTERICCISGAMEAVLEVVAIIKRIMAQDKHVSTYQNMTTSYSRSMDSSPSTGNRGGGGGGYGGSYNGSGGGSGYPGGHSAGGGGHPSMNYYGAMYGPGPGHPQQVSVPYYMGNGMGVEMSPNGGPMPHPSATHEQLALGMGGPSNQGQFVQVQVAIPDFLVGAVLGKRGTRVLEIQEATGTRIQISPRGEFVPGTLHRAVVITGTMQAAVQAQYLISQRMQQALLEGYQAQSEEHYRAMGLAGALQPPPQQDYYDPSGSTAPYTPASSASYGEGAAGLRGASGAPDAPE